MSRTNPQKKKRRVAKQTLLMFGEGLGEEVFLKHLRGLYSYNSGTAVKIKKGRGGDAVGIVIDAGNVPGDFDRKVVILDNDKDTREMISARTEAGRRGIELLENTPCLEAILLSILNEGKSFSGKKTDWCKKEFESKYLDKKRRTELREYEKIFPKDLLDKQRINISELDKFILCMGND